MTRKGTAKGVPPQADFRVVDWKTQKLWQSGKLSYKSVKKTSLRMYFTGLFVFLVVQTCHLVHHLVKIGLQALQNKKASNAPTSHVFC